MASVYAPPGWMEMSAAQYRRILNREAVSITKRDRKRGGVYRVKEALDALHCAFHRSDGTDPYDGMAMDANGLVQSSPANQARCPAVAHRGEEPIADFEILSRQTRQAKGSMTGEDYLAHCRAVVVQAQRLGHL
ncbi:hypothetical protein [Parasynechococcus sp.]|uniref:hypothetical protein n=1 Tax=Parasynechococcus sp. TaxID=3101203 RepID=UPI00370455F9